MPAILHALIVAPLAWLGRRGTLAVALSAVFGIMLPSLSAFARPLLEEAVFALLVLAFLRVDAVAIRVHLARPRLLAGMIMWMMIVVPLSVALLGRVTGLAHAAPELMLALFIVTVTPPLMSGPAFAYLLGLDGALSLAVLIFGMIVTPITAPLIAGFALEVTLSVSIGALALRLAGFLVGSALVAIILRRIIGVDRIVAAKSEIDGLNVVLLFVFAVAALDGVAASFADDPLMSLGVALLTVVVSLVQIGLTMLVFFRLPRSEAAVLGLAAGNRNMSLLIAALGASVPDFTWLFFALGQLPIYFLPLIVKPIAARLASPATPAGPS